MTTLLPSAFEYFVAEKVPFGAEPNVLACLDFDFTDLTFSLSIEEDGVPEYQISSGHEYWPAQTPDAVYKFIKEVKADFGVKKFPKDLRDKAVAFLLRRDRAESFEVLVTKPSRFRHNAGEDILTACYFPELPGTASGAIAVKRGEETVSGSVDDPAVLKKAVTILNDALQGSNQDKAVADIFCLLLSLGRDISGDYAAYGLGKLIPYKGVRNRMVEELLDDSGAVKRPKG